MMPDQPRVVVGTRVRVFLVCLVFILLTAWCTLRQNSPAYVLDTAAFRVWSLDDRVESVAKQWQIHSHPECAGNTVAVGVALSLNGISNFGKTKVYLADTPFFTDLLPSFCATASHGYCYKLFVAFDHDDVVLSLPEGRFTFINNFRRLAPNCLEHHRVNLQFVKCNYSGRPASSQNDALMAAYREDFDYYFMVNDDSLFTSIAWTEDFIDTLRNMTPQNVGTTGPIQIGGNVAIMTYNFVHRTHLDIFGYFYPPVFHTWSADAWMTRVYEPDNSYKSRQSVVVHMQELGKRYKSTPFSPDEMEAVLERTRGVLRAYLQKQRFKRHAREDDSSISRV